MHILITGANGQIAWEIQHIAKKYPIKITALTKQQCDISQSNLIEQAIVQNHADIIINTAAYTAVDRAELETEQAFEINHFAVANLAQICADRHIPLLHYSTDYVFSGNQTKAYHEEDPVEPLSVYGKSKWQGEHAIHEICPHAIILRVSSVFSSHGKNFVKSILNAAHRHKELKVVNDQFVCPTPAVEIAQISLTVIKQLFNSPANYWGTYHYSSNQTTSWYAFARSCIKLAKPYGKVITEKITPISTTEYGAAATRPAHSVLNCEKIHRTFGIANKPWKAGLAQVIKEYYEKTL